MTAKTKFYKLGSLKQQKCIGDHKSEIKVLALLDFSDSF